MIPSVSTLTAHYWIPAGSVDDALCRSDIIAMAGASVSLRHGQMTVGVRHRQPSEHGVIRSLPQRSLILPLDASPRLLVHLRVTSPAPAVGHL